MRSDSSQEERKNRNRVNKDYSHDLPLECNQKLEEKCICSHLSPHSLELKEEMRDEMK